MSSFLKLDTRPTALPVMPEGQYKLVCTNAAYTLRNKDHEISQANVKGLLCSFQFKVGGKTGELVHNFNLFHADDAVRRMGVEDFGVMCKAMGFTIDSASGYALNAAGEIVEPKDLKGKTPQAHIIVRDHWQNADQKQNVVKSWIMPKASSTTEEPPLPELDSHDVNAPYDDDVPY